MEVEKYIKVVANTNQLYILPDSSKVWMEPGSTIQYIRSFNQDRRVWLKGNSLFEVSKHKGSTFQVYIDKAFIEVKGTCFHIKQNDENEITLFNGKIDFNAEMTGKKISLNPMHKVIYNPKNAEIRVEEFANIDWKNGVYTFTDIQLSLFIETINQMYNSNIILENNIIKECTFNGSIRYDESLDNILEKICYSMNFKIKHTDNEILIYQ